MPEPDILKGAVSDPLETYAREAFKLRLLEPIAQTDPFSLYRLSQLRQDTSSNGSKDNQSYLDLAVRTALNPAAKLVTGHEIGDEFSLYTRSFLKTVPLFMKGRLGIAGLALGYVLDEAKISDPYQEQALDAGLGLLKAGTLKSSFAAMSRYGTTPGLTGVGLGITLRFSDTALTRRNYYDEHGSINVGRGLDRALSVALNPAALVIDAATYGAADIFWARAMNYSRGRVWFSPPLKHALAASTMGFTSGAGFELHRQLASEGEINPLEILRKGALQASFDAAGGALGGLQAQRHMQLKHLHQDAPDAVAQARKTAFQRGELADHRQRELRDGEFVLDRHVSGLTMQTILGRVKSPSGEMIPAVFRADDGSAAFGHRMQSEIAAYGMQGLGFKANVPVTVARHIEVGGKRVVGYVQELEGRSLAEFIENGVQRKGTTYTRRDVVKFFENNKSFRESYTDAWLYRLIMGEWDNHARNMAVIEGSRGLQVKNIDLGDGLRPAQSTMDLQPVPGVRQGYDLINSWLYNKVAGNKLPLERVAELSTLHARFSTTEGKAQLQALGMTGQQIEGILGRMQWFMKNKQMPRQQEPLFYLHLNDARRFVERIARRLGSS